MIVVPCTLDDNGIVRSRETLNLLDVIIPLFSAGCKCSDNFSKLVEYFALLLISPAMPCYVHGNKFCCIIGFATKLAFPAFILSLS
tara:strand:- start:373 stop:630 length:258 start_codon:yes stop_codon:yes gene_type:complete